MGRSVVSMRSRAVWARRDAGEREGTSPDLGREQAVQVALRVGEPSREA